MRTARQQGVIRVVRCGTWPSSNVCARAPPVNIFFAAVVNVAYTRLKVDKDIMDALVHLNKKPGGKDRGEKPPEIQSWRRRYGPCFTLTMSEPSRNRPRN